MFEGLEPQSPDALLALIKLYADDERPDKIDLGVGVYRDTAGNTPVFRSIKAAEQALVNEQHSKAYLGPEGDLAFVAALEPYLFDEALRDSGKGIAGMQTPGGTGAVRLALALAKKAGATRVLLGTPSWPNHAQILADLDLEMVAFDHAKDDGTADIEGVLQAIGGAEKGDAIIVHACCHNPTGIDYTQEDWERIAQALADRPVLPIIDVAYQGLGNGLSEDVAGAQTVLHAVSEALIAYSCDKNFGLYRDRVGALYMMMADRSLMDTITSNANALARATWSMPPDHGAAAVRLVLNDATMKQDWLDELTSMRERIRTMREQLAVADNAAQGLDLTPLARQNGLFAMLKLDKAQIKRLREQHAIYMAGSGRINIAGLTEDNIDRFIRTLGEVTQRS